MVDHIRKQIRDAAKTALTGLATTGNNVFSGRVSPLKVEELPGLLVYLNSDDPTEGAYNGGATAQHSSALRIEGVATANDDLIDLLDRMALEIETAIFADAGLNALLMMPPSPPSAIISIDDPVEGLARRLGSVILSFPIQYRTRLGAPQTQV